MLNKIGPIQHLLLRLASPLMVFLVVAPNLQAQDKPVMAPAQAPVQVTEPLTMTTQQTLEVNELAALKAMMGGGATESLKGVVTGADPEQLFLESIKKLSAQGKMAAMTLPPAPTSPLKRVSRSARGTPQAALRASAKKLEDLAADLERVQLYDKADELRAIAAKYWFEARSMN